MTHSDSPRAGTFAVAGRSIEALWLGPPPEQAPTLVLLHEGLGCAAMWRDFPRRLAECTGCGVLVYSRPGYGQSDAVPLPRPLSYMHDEANEVLPAVLEETRVGRTILIGHSDGASIATIYAGSRQDFRVRGLVLIAPHFFVEESGLRAIAAAKEAYEKRDLRARLARYHRHVDVAFRGWNDAWLDERFRTWRIDEYLPYIRVPVLIIQGDADEYGTASQIDLARAETFCPVDVVLLHGSGHSPHLDAAEATLTATSKFVHRIMAVHEGLMPAA
jgi:pimeloyl-ACP methyl ester carboxylesterase